MGVTCTCTVFAPNDKFHSPDCPKHKTYAQRLRENKSERKAGKKERLKKLMKSLCTDEPPPIDEELRGVLGD